ncbi:MAG: 16S rRNA (guanine(1405)-N(7))-methyltransferase RmtF [Candidatus Excrementavichristensenella sp.]|jgi:16S rRNA (guanine(1405)-N(7))-methyltransferase
MNEKERDALLKLQNSRNHKALCPKAVERVFLQALARYPGLKEADKAARDQLHQIAGAFLRAGEVKRARNLLDRGAPVEALLALHASTRERPGWREIYRRIFEKAAPAHVVDLACGLNPLCLGALGMPCLGLDLYAGAVELVNAYAARAGWPVRCEVWDLLGDRELPGGDLVLMMKLLPVLERQQSGAGAHLLARAKGRHKLVSFPTRTLGGRNVGMEAHYENWLMDHLPEGHRVRDRFVQNSELFCLLEDTNG